LHSALPVEQGGWTMAVIITILVGHMPLVIVVQEPLVMRSNQIFPDVRFLE
jgi:hypothetical protein